jgi:predicted nuclease of restriction endonuclease-like (RecB) superfamily
MRRHKNSENALIGKLQDFLLGLGNGFSFVRRQQQIASDALLCCASRLNRRSLAKN